MNKKITNKNKLYFIMLGIIFNFLLALGAHAANHFVRQGATSGGNGNDWNNAYTSLPTALTRGDTYYIAAGNYPGRSFNTPVNGTALITIKKAIESDHGTDTGWSAAYGTGQSTFTSQLGFDSSYWLVDGQTGGGPGSWGSNFGFKIREVGQTNAVIRIGNSSSEPHYTGVTVRHVEMQGISGSGAAGGSASNDGVAIYGSSDFTLSYAWMYGLGRCPVFGYSQGINIFEYVYVSEYSLFGSNGVHSEVASLGQNSLGDFTWRYNLVTTVKSTGGLMWNSANHPDAHLYIYGNVFYKPTGGDWDTGNNGLIGGWTNYATNNIWVYNNSFINVPYNPISSISGVGTGNLVYNNIFYNSYPPNYGTVFPTHDYNDYINSGTIQGEAHGTSATSGNPFVNIVGLDFRLNANTAAGISLLAPYSTDPLGNTRGINGVFNRGAFQFIDNTPLLMPPSLLNGKVVNF